MREGMIDRLTALSLEAQRRGISYGALMASTTRWERDRIAEKQRDRSGKRRRRKT